MGLVAQNVSAASYSSVVASLRRPNASEVAAVDDHSGGDTLAVAMLGFGFRFEFAVEKDAGEP